MEQNNTPTPSNKRHIGWRIWSWFMLSYGSLYVVFTFITIYDVSIEVPAIKVFLALFYLLVIGVEIETIRQDFLN